MFPFFEPINWFLIYTFWLTLTISFFAFLWMLKKLSIRFWYDFIIFKKNILWFFLSIFFFSRLFYVISKWHDLKYIKNPLEFFIMNDYNFSLFWAIFWFLIVLYITLKIRKEKLDKFIDWLAISLFFILSIWFIWALFWWQVYWKETTLWIEILYTNPFTPVPFQVPIFPLPIVYSILFFILFSISYISSMYIHTKWIIWYIWLIIMSLLFIIFEFFSWKYDIFRDNIWINLTQILSIIFIIFCIYRLIKIFSYTESKDKTILN